MTARNLKLCAMLLSTACMPHLVQAQDAPVIKLTVINSSETDVPTYILGHVLARALAAAGARVEVVR